MDFNPTTGTQPIYKRVFDRLSVMLDEGTRHVLNMAAMLGHRLKRPVALCFSRPSTPTDDGRDDRLSQASHLARQRDRP